MDKSLQIKLEMISSVIGDGNKSDQKAHEEQNDPVEECFPKDPVGKRVSPKSMDQVPVINEKDDFCNQSRRKSHFCEAKSPQLTPFKKVAFSPVDQDEKEEKKEKDRKYMGSLFFDPK